MPTQNIVNGFATTGIYDPNLKGPNKNAISQSVFKPEDLRRYKNNLPHPNASIDVNHSSVTDSVKEIAISSPENVQLVPAVASTSNSASQGIEVLSRKFIFRGEDLFFEATNSFWLRFSVTGPDVENCPGARPDSRRP